ncbi:MAG: pirin family protein [Ignavibacterium sp.]|nr:MAG: pirin family protein [Ignavibacterium sp.]
MRKVKQVIPSSKVNMGGIILDQPLPTASVDQIDPFLLIHHWHNVLPGNQKQNEVGVGPHPHRGFSPVTFIFKGGVHHRDSRGNDSIIYEGGTQWMNAGRGIVHSERPHKKVAEEGGEFEIIQFWVNNPAKFKMEHPSYQPLSKDNTPVYSSENGKAKVYVVAGNYKGLEGKISAHSPLITLRMELEENGTLDFSIQEDYNTLIYQLDGELTVNDSEQTKAKDLIWFDNDGKEEIKISANKKSRAILLAGEPLNEEVVSYGPFVMNSQTEVMEAMRDAQMGKMGVLIEEF